MPQSDFYLFHISVLSFLGGTGTGRSMGHRGPHQHSHMTAHSSIQTCQLHMLETKINLHFKFILLLQVSAIFFLILPTAAAHHPLSECSVLVPVSLRPPPDKVQGGSDWTSLTGLSTHRPLCFCISCAGILRCAGGVSEGDDCIVLTSQREGSPDSLFEGTASEYGLCAFLFGFSIVILSQYLQST